MDNNNNNNQSKKGMDIDKDGDIEINKLGVSPSSDEHAPTKAANETAATPRAATMASEAGDGLVGCNGADDDGAGPGAVAGDQQHGGVDDDRADETRARESSAERVCLFTTTIGTLKIKTEVSRLRQLLTAKKIEFQEVDLSIDRSRREAMLEASGGNATLPQLHVDGKVRCRLARVRFHPSGARTYQKNRQRT